MSGPRSTALGASLALRGALQVSGLVLIGLGAATCIAAAFALPAHARAAALLPTVAVPLIAWLGGGTFAFGVGFRALLRDREEGLLDLARARGVPPSEYARGRVAGLVVVLSTALGAAAIVAAASAIASAGGGLSVLRASGAGLTYALVFSMTLGPLAIAALGTSSRPAGYLTLLTVLVLPELLAPWTSRVLPSGWHELTSIPAAMDAVRDAWIAPQIAWPHALRAVVALVAVVAASLLFLHGSAGRWARR